MTESEKIFVNNPTPTIQEEVLTLRIENAEQKEIIKSLQLKLNANGCDSVTDYMLYLRQKEISRRYRQKNAELMKRIKSLQKTDLQKENDILQVKIHRMKYCVKAIAKHSLNPKVRKAMKELLRRWF